MDTTIDDGWKCAVSLHHIPTSVFSPINILKGAPPEYLEIVIKLESMENKWERAKIARAYLDQNGGITSISHRDLKAALKYPDGWSLSFWRQMYLVERSIPPRSIKQEDGTYIWLPDISWVDRLKIFANTAMIEHAVVYKQLRGLPGELRFSRHSGDHDNLEAKPGESAADFYCWDKVNNCNYAFVELKCPQTADIEEAKKRYASPTSRYKARFVLMFLTDHSYKLVDYDTDTIIDQPGLSVPKGLFVI